MWNSGQQKHFSRVFKICETVWGQSRWWRNKLPCCSDAAFIYVEIQLMKPNDQCLWTLARSLANQSLSSCTFYMLVYIVQCTLQTTSHSQFQLPMLTDSRVFWSVNSSYYKFILFFLTNDAFKKWWGQKRAFKRSGEDLQRLHQSCLQTFVCSLPALTVNGSRPDVITWERNFSRMITCGHIWKREILTPILVSRFWMALDVKVVRDFLSCHWSTRHSYQTRPFLKSDRVVI